MSYWRSYSRGCGKTRSPVYKLYASSEGLLLTRRISISYLHQSNKLLNHTKIRTARVLAQHPYYSNSADSYADRGLTPSPDAKANCGRSQQASRGHRPRWPSRLNESRSALISRAAFGYHESGFP